MKTWIALLRGIDVGGSHVVPMKNLLSIVESCGCSDVKTYIQSGNVVFRSRVSDGRALASRISRGVLKQHGFEPRIMVLSAEQLRRAIAANPFPQAEAEPKTLHLFFLAGTPKVRLEVLEEVKVDESFAVQGRVLYLHTPRGLAPSKVAARIDRAVGVESTARNWRTCQKVMELADALE